MTEIVTVLVEPQVSVVNVLPAVAEVVEVSVEPSVVQVIAPETSETVQVFTEPEVEIIQISIPGIQGPPGVDGSTTPTFESVSKNLEQNPYTLNYIGDVLSTVVYTTGAGTITKTLLYDLAGVLSSIVLSGNTPMGIDLTKTLTYTGDNLTAVAYS